MNMSWSRYSFFLFCLIWVATVADCAINLDGTQAVDPAGDDDPSPISDINTYHPDQHDCPLTCTDFSNVHSWITYFSVQRLQRCHDPMLLKFSALQPLDSLDSTILIRGCTLTSKSRSVIKNTTTVVENPKKDKTLYEGGSLKTSAACVESGTLVKDKMSLSTSRGVTHNQTVATNAISLLQGMKKYFDAKDNCNENFLFGYHGEIVVGLYIGAGLGKSTASSALYSLSQHLDSSSSIANQTFVQLHDLGRKANRVFGIFLDTTGDIAAVQKATRQWSEGSSAVGKDVVLSGSLSNVKVYDIAGITHLPDFDEPTSTPTPTPSPSNEPKKLVERLADFIDSSILRKRATCKNIVVGDGDSCTTLVRRCGIRGADFVKYNPQSGLCASLEEGDHVCCSAGDPYKPSGPKPEADGTCATHVIEDGDTCAKLAKKHSVTVKELEKWNKNTWAWTDCTDLLVSYSMCLSSGSPPMPSPQEGAACGPLVPGTKRPANSSISLADLNPCPLKACCSNWGFCGIFPDHCAIHEPDVGGPGSKMKGYQNTCVSNCGHNIRENSGRPKEWSRIGYYEAWNFARDCLWLKAKNANTDGSYTHIHWAFASIDPQTWKPIIKEGKDQWADFKKLSAKRIVSFGGWADSTAPDKYAIIRNAIITNRETFATNLAKFVKDEGLDGVDIDWEYPGAEDIMVGGSPIGAKSDGVNYLRFLTTLREKLDSDMSLSIAAPASYWYLKAFPIDRISEVVDYIVYMTYDLHGQWDYGNPNAFDECPSGKCIRSHVNMTETRQALSMITKAGVANNKIFVGESSYGRSFRMAKSDCWKPECEFTGSKEVSDATPGRCTKEGGYISNAEINEILLSGGSKKAFYDSSSESNILLYKGDYISYMTDSDKFVRRVIWKDFNFAGTIDWAVDLQQFRNEDFDAPPDIPESGIKCRGGEDNKDDGGNLCYFACQYGFCPESICTCVEEGEPEKLPSVKNRDEIVANDPFDVDLNRLCKFACKYGFCPSTVCMRKPSSTADDEDEVPEGIVTVPPDYDEDSVKARDENNKMCYIYRGLSDRQDGLESCKKQCQATLDEAEEEGRISNYGCYSLRPLDSPITWQRSPSTGLEIIGGQCSCDNWILNDLMDTIMEALPAIFQTICYIFFSTIKLVIDVGTSFFPPGRALTAGADMLLTGAEMINWVYNKDEDPAGAFEWWLSPCGGTDLVPEEIKQAYDILGQVPTGRSSFRGLKNIKKGSGKKGDEGNPTDRSAPRPIGGNKKPPAGGNNPNPKPTPTPTPTPKPKCSVPKASQTQQLGALHNTLQLLECDANDKTVTTVYVVTSLTYAANAKPTGVTSTCKEAHTQACYHYSSANVNNPHWSTLTCPQEAASTARERGNGVPAPQATKAWKAEHIGRWRHASLRDDPRCDMDEWPPFYLLSLTSDTFQQSGVDRTGQRMRWLNRGQNTGAGHEWKGVCFGPALDGMTVDDFYKMVKDGKEGPKAVTGDITRLNVEVDVEVRPEFSFVYEFDEPAFVGNKLRDAGLWDNGCWPKKAAKTDPGFVLLSYDEWYDKNPTAKVWDYKKRYNPNAKTPNGDK